MVDARVEDWARGDEWIGSAADVARAIRSRLAPGEWQPSDRTVRHWLRTGSLAIPWVSSATTVTTAVAAFWHLQTVVGPTKQARPTIARQMRHHADIADECGAPSLADVRKAKGEAARPRAGYPVTMNPDLPDR